MHSVCNPASKTMIWIPKYRIDTVTQGIFMTTMKEYFDNPIEWLFLRCEQLICSITLCVLLFWSQFSLGITTKQLYFFMLTVIHTTENMQMLLRLTKWRLFYTMSTCLTKFEVNILAKVSMVAHNVQLLVSIWHTSWTRHQQCSSPTKRILVLITNTTLNTLFFL